jgi:Xaa-Pro aminopeptidase
VPDVLILADTVRSATLRHEVPIAIPDPFLYVEHGDERHVVVTSFEVPRLAELGLYTIHPLEEFGFDELRRTSGSYDELMDEIAVRALRAFGVDRAVVPGSFPLGTADRLRAEGIELTPGRELFGKRRRVKTGFELAGIRRAQAAATAGMAVARDLLRAATSRRDGVLEHDGRPLTSERVRVAVAAAFVANGATGEDFVVSHGPQAAIGHYPGSGELRAGETIVVDLWPRDAESGCYADMTRTFVVGDVPDEVAEWHRLCGKVLGRALAETRAGVTGRSIHEGACEEFEAAGYPTQRTKAEDAALEEGFLHSLGHGVGLEVHEEPALGLLGHDPLVAGDVVTIEPGLYRPGFGGVRLEDLILVTDAEAENLTDFPYDLAP